MKLFNTIHNYLFSCVQIIRWKKQIISTPQSAAISRVRISTPIIVIAPHADDELIGCYRLIKEYGANVCILYCSLTGTDQSKENKQKREQEFINFCQIMSCQYFINEGKIDKFLEEQILRCQPQTICLPNFFDWHDEHRLVNIVLRDVLAKNNLTPQIIWYTISVPFLYTEMNFCLLMTKLQQREKWNHFKKYYSSQKNLPIKRFELVEKHIARQAFACEPYCLMPYTHWIDKLTRWEPIQYKLNGLKTDINDLSKIYKEVQDISINSKQMY